MTLSLCLSLSPLVLCHTVCCCYSCVIFGAHKSYQKKSSQKISEESENVRLDEVYSVTWQDESFQKSTYKVICRRTLNRGSWRLVKRTTQTWWKGFDSSVSHRSVRRNTVILILPHDIVRRGSLYFPRQCWNSHWDDIVRAVWDLTSISVLRVLSRTLFRHRGHQYDISLHCFFLTNFPVDVDIFLIWNSARSVISFPVESLSVKTRPSVSVTLLVSFLFDTYVILKRSLSSVSSDDHAWDHLREDCICRVSGQSPLRLWVCTLWLVSFRCPRPLVGSSWQMIRFFLVWVSVCCLLTLMVCHVLHFDSSSINSSSKIGFVKGEKKWSAILVLFFDYYYDPSPKDLKDGLSSLRTGSWQICGTRFDA